ncbi:hypothetical protein [Sphingomonas hankookensis]|uniref:hypothetical protein n=1 Tax=Sphingomonas hankookensis TaxID=563996 RepID=UPI003F7A698D
MPPTQSNSVRSAPGAMTSVGTSISPSKSSSGSPITMPLFGSTAPIQKRTRTLCMSSVAIVSGSASFGGNNEKLKPGASSPAPSE